jgi:hypothetical protein
MGLLDGTTQQAYYQGNDFGNYQFTSLEDVINQFIAVYVGENKIINKISRASVAFHAQRALAELSFDTFKSIKAQEIVLPPSNTMILPQDYVNYTRVMWSDSSGIKHPIYPTRDTQNPFQIKQDDDGNYAFIELGEEVTNGNFETAVGSEWIAPYYWDATLVFPTLYTTIGPVGANDFSSSKLTFQHQSVLGLNPAVIWYTINHIYQTLDVSDKSFVNLSASGQAVDSAGGAIGTLRVGLSTSPPVNDSQATENSINNPNTSFLSRNNTLLGMWDLQDENGSPSYLEWTVAGDNTSNKSLAGIDVTGIDTIYVIAVSWHPFTTAENTLQDTNNVDNISVINAGVTGSLSSPNPASSSTWDNYSSATPSENENSYDDGTYLNNLGERYGLDPQHAQTNGSFYVDNLRGLINFSSNMSGKTVILDYISDSLGTDGEMKVHKFAEEAMYRWMLYAIASSRTRTQQLVPRLKKEKVAAVRQAKLRLSNIKLEELTQILRGKSKHIKH